MKKILLTITMFFLIISSVFAEQGYTIKTGISIDKVPKDFYGTWRVSSKLVSSNNKEIFKGNSVDLWNLSRVGDVITLDNPFSGAKASITINVIDGKFIKFRKIGDYGGKRLTDTVRMNLGKDSFTGLNDLKLDTISEIDGRVMKTEWASYSLKGEKISGDSVK